MSKPHWGEFETRRQGADGEHVSPARESFADICARALTTADGRELLRHLYAQYVDKRCRPNATEAELREAEAQRRLVFELERARDEGLERSASRAKN